MQIISYGIQETENEKFKKIRINHEGECWIEKSVQKIADWDNQACQVFTNGDREGQIFLSHSHTNYGFFFLHH